MGLDGGVDVMTLAAPMGEKEGEVLRKKFDGMMSALYRQRGLILISIS